LLTATFIHDERAELFSNSCFIFHSKYDFIIFLLISSQWQHLLEIRVFKS